MGKLITNQDPKLVDDNTDDEVIDEELEDQPSGDEIDPDEDETDPEGADSLGDPGKKALDRMKTERNEAKRASRAQAKEIAELKRQLEAKDKTPEENELEQARAEARAEALTAANARVLRSEVKSAAAGKLKNPADALKLLELTDFDIDDNGDVDTTQIQEAIDDLLADKPYLAAQGGGTSFDSGRGKQPRKRKLTKADLTGMKPAEVAKAYDEGRVQL